MPSSVLNRLGYPVIFLVAFIACGYALGSALGPLLAALIFVYAVYPTAMKLELRGVPAALSVTLAFGLLSTLFVLFCIFVIPVFYRDFESFLLLFPQNVDKFLHWVQPWLHRMGIKADLTKHNAVDQIRASLEHFSLSSLAWTGELTGRVFESTWMVLLVVFQIILFPVFSIFIVSNYREIHDEVLSWMPVRVHPFVADLLKEANSIFSGYVRGQSLVCLTLAALYGGGLFLVGLKFGLVIGVLTGMFAFVPYMGLVCGLTSALVITLTTGGGWVQAVSVLAVYVAIQTLDALVITPRVIGSKLGLSALESLLALIMGANVAGAYGMVAAIPSAALIKIAVIRFKQQYINSEFFKKDAPAAVHTTSFESPKPTENLQFYPDTSAEVPLPKDKAA